MNFLITGACGFIGSSITRDLIKKGHSCIAIDNMSTGFHQNIPGGVFLITGDIGSPMAISKLNNLGIHFDAIIHMAGQSSAEVSFDNPIYDMETNLKSTLLLLQFAKENNCKKFIYASSMSVYGNAYQTPCSEETETSPNSFYAAGKLASENYMRIYSQFGIACTALRFFNVYGIGQNMQNLRQGIISIFLAQAIKKRHIHVKGSKNRFRDLVYIDDVVDAVNLSLLREDGFKVYNVCTGEATTVETMIRTIQEKLSFDVTVRYEGETLGDIFGIYGDYEKIYNDLGWYPKVKFDIGMEKMIEWAMSGKW